MIPICSYLGEMALIDDTISWSFGSEESIHPIFQGKTFYAQVAMICFEQRHYGVYASYGQDLIAFDDPTLKIVKRK